MSLVTYHGFVEQFTTIRRERLLPRPGEVLKRPGQSVSALDVVARARIPQDHRIIEVARALGVSAETVNRYILKRPGETVEEDEPIAARRMIAGLRRMMVRSPIEGEVVESGGGIIILEGEPDIVEVRASLPGSIIENKAPWGVVVEAAGARVQLAWGRGELHFTELKLIPLDEQGHPNPNNLDTMEHRGSVVVSLAPLTEVFLRAAEDVAAGGVVAPSMDASLLPLAGELELAIGLSEGFGQLKMADELIELLRSNSGRQLSLDPGSPDGWRFSRPEIIIPVPDSGTPPTLPEHGEPLQLGHRVRILRGPHRGAIGTIVGLPERPRELPSGLHLMGVEVDLSEGAVVFAPFANLEHLG